MKKHRTSESGLSKIRLLGTLVFCFIGLALSWIAIAAPPGSARLKSKARVIVPNATPGSGILNPGGPNVPWSGSSATGGSSPNEESTCVQGVNCDSFQLTLSGNPSDWSGKQAHIVLSWTNPAGNTDLDLFIHKGNTTAGPVVGSSAASGPGPEIVDLDPNNPTIGTGVFTVNVVYFLAEPGMTYTGTASSIGGAVPTPTPPGATPTPTPTPGPALPYIPRYQTYYPPAGTADSAGEPSIGVNWNTEQTHTNNRASDGAVNPAIPNGGTENYYGGFLTYMLRARFNDCSSPANVDWQQKTVTLPAAPRAAGDPILFTDHETGRTFVVQLLGLTPAGSTIEYTDDDGENFCPSEGGAPSGVDHETIGGGPLHQIGGVTPPTTVPSLACASNPAPTPYPHAVHYASQSVADATDELSLDGGVTFPVQSPMFTAAQCDGLHGHLKVAPDGTAFVPDKGCTAVGGVPLVNGGEASVAVSEDNGATWTIRTIHGETTPGNDDPSVGVPTCRPNDPTCDKAALSNTIYLGYQAATPTGQKAKIAVSHDKGVTWEHITDVGALPGGPVINNMAFPEVVAGDPDRAAFAFFGSPTPGTNPDQPAFPGVWYLYIATTTDGGVTWTTINATPDDPIQRGGICGSGTCRNLLDFFDIQVDKEGRIVVGGEDGCVGGCVNGGPNSFTAKGFITRQSGGRRLFANFDPTEPTFPGAPLVSGGVTGSTVQLTWPEPDNGAAPITAYKIYKNASFTPVATVTTRNYTDTAFTVGDAYRVTAVNQQGEGPYCGNFTPSTGPVASACILPGLLVSNDLTPTGGDNDSGQNTPPDPRVNARQLFVAEPFVSAGVENLVFTLQVAPSTTNAPPANSQWMIIWNRQAPGTGDPGDANDANFDRMYIAMVTDAAGSPQFEYGKFGIPINTSPPPPPSPDANTPKKAGLADSGSYNPLTGVIQITISKSKLRAIDGGATKYVPGTDLAATNVRTYFNRPDYISDPTAPVRSQRSQNNASDITPDGTYSIVGNASCAPAPQLVKAVSRKTHLNEDFDVQLAPIVPANLIGIEDRVGQGANANQHHVVVTFAAPVTFTSASATSNTTGKNAAVTGTSSPTTASSEITIDLTADDQQKLTISLVGVTAGGASVNISIPMGVLLGDVDGTGRVDSGDISAMRQQTSSPVDDGDFRFDIDITHRIDSSDLSYVRQNSNHFIPNYP